VSHPSPDWLKALQAAKAAAKSEAEAICRRAKSDGREHLSEQEAENFHELLETTRALSARITETQGEVERHTGSPLVNRLMNAGNSRRAAGVHYSKTGLQRAFASLRDGGTAVIESRGFNSVEAFLPPELYGFTIGPVHEARLLSYLPSIPMTAPSIEFLLHTTTSGSPAVVGEGALKPELVYTVIHQTVTAAKIAAHTAISYEVLQDFPTWTGYVTNELSKEIIAVENNALLNGDGTGAIVGLIAQAGLSYGKGTLGGGTETSLDAIEIGIAALRTGASLAEPDLFVCHPLTWSTVRREKDTLGRYLVTPDPTLDEPNKVGVFKC
jgi:HK97 family phage major capsid protein